MTKIKVNRPAFGVFAKRHRQTDIDDRDKGRQRHRERAEQRQRKDKNRIRETVRDKLTALN